MEELFQQEIDISVIIASYNKFELLERCLDSLILHTIQIKYEIIVIDNNSTEGNIKDELSRYENIILIQNSKNKGFGAANNQGLNVAKGKYVLFLNNDTIFLENTLKIVFDFAESLNFPAIIGCKILNEDKSLQHSVYDFPSLLNLFTSNFFFYVLLPKSKYFNKYYLMNRKINSVTKVDVVTGAFLFSKTFLIRSIGGFDERFFFYNEETDLCYRFVKNRGQVLYFPETSIVHLKGGTAKRTSWFAYRNQSVATIQFFQKHFRGLKFLLALTIHFIGLLIRIPILFMLGLLTFRNHLLYRSLCFIGLLFIYPQNKFK